MRSQHDGLVAALRAEGVDVVDGGAMPHRLMNAVYVRDPMCVVRGGAVIGRMGPLMRRGEERYATQSVAALGMPILRTIHGTGTLEGGTVVKITPRSYAFGASIRCNPEGARQLAEVLAPLGIELIVVPLPGRSIHLDGHLSMVDRDKALCDLHRLPYWFTDRLRELGIELIEQQPDEHWAINGARRPARAPRAQRGPAAHRRAARRARRRGRRDPVRRDPARRRRHPLHHHGAAARPPRVRRSMHVIDLTAIPVGPTEFGEWAALNAPLGLDASASTWSRQLRTRGRERHDEVESAQQELFVVISGRARFVVGDETYDAGPGTAVGIGDPAVKRGYRPSSRARACSASGRSRRASRRAGATGSAAASREVTSLLTREPVASARSLTLLPEPGLEVSALDASGARPVHAPDEACGG